MQQLASQPHSRSEGEIADNLRQMIAVLEGERQALAALDASKLDQATTGKEILCEALAGLGPEALDAETRALAETARRLNDVNRRVRNLLAANVASRIESLGEARSTAPTGGLAA